MLGEARLERELGEWMESCVVRHEENRFGCTLSAKLFVGVEYVIKHIKTKQTEHVEAQTEKILDQIYLENYLAGAREEDREAKRKGRAAATRCPEVRHDRHNKCSVREGAIASRRTRSAGA